MEFYFTKGRLVLKLLIDDLPSWEPTSFKGLFYGWVLNSKPLSTSLKSDRFLALITYCTLLGL
jgi:hypothetical protein